MKENMKKKCNDCNVFVHQLLVPLYHVVDDMVITCHCHKKCVVQMNDFKQIEIKAAIA